MKGYDLITPEGTRDLLFDECVARKREEDRLRYLFIMNGYSEVITPALEFYDVFNMKARSFRQESMYKLVDGKGRLMVMRPDSTMPIARIVATRLKDRNKPLKLFYSQNIYRCNPKLSGRDDEILQTGIEIIGGDEKRADLEALSLAAKVLCECGSTDTRLEIGDNTFYKYLLYALSLQDDEETVRAFIESKNTPELKNWIAEKTEKITDGNKRKYAELLLTLPKLFGGEEVFDTAEKLFSNTELADRLTELKETYNALCRLYDKNSITVDLGLVNKAEYYTGIIFRGYIEEYGQAVISGGRYDTLIGSFGAADTGAIGFAANVNAIAAATLQRANEPLSKSADVLVFAKDGYLTEGIRHCDNMTETGVIAEFCTCSDVESAIAYAKENGIQKLIVIDENTQTIEL
ncbi:MAG: ATP phosphoribosyltransferase regulatory subunit [Ruminococcaceae bacterium]|nr:ATP phosphoribosyltransferase regulatory subunit [Oscillospiraceae bacterium]